MKTYCCDHCKKVIAEDDVEAIEVMQPYQRALFSKEGFVPVKYNNIDTNQHVHYCGECKMIYHTEWF